MHITDGYSQWIDTVEPLYLEQQYLEHIWSALKVSATVEPLYLESLDILIILTDS